jgi:hypothetical protein
MSDTVVGIGTGDFLKKEAETPLSGVFIAAGVRCEIRTNCESILATARESFLPADSSEDIVDLRMRFWVDPETRSQPPWSKPYLRGLDHLVFAGFDNGSSMLADLRTARVIGRFSPDMAADQTHWKTVIFPMLFSIVGGSLGIVELHCACVSQNGSALLLAGPSGAGKSSLSYALAQSSFGFLSDDRTLCFKRNASVFAWGLPTHLKLRQEGRDWFQALQERDPTHKEKGEWVYRLEPQHDLGLERVRCCRPAAIIFLERQEASSFALTPVSSGEAAHRLEQELMPELPDAASKQAATIARLVEVPCWRLQYGGCPQEVAQKIKGCFESGQLTDTSGHDLSYEARVPGGIQHETEAPTDARTSNVAPPEKSVDPIHRFIPTPYSKLLHVMGRTLRLETNDTRILERIAQVFSRYPSNRNHNPEFVWKILCQSRPKTEPPWPRRFVFSDRGLRFAEYGQNNFVAVDLAAREGIGAFSEQLMNDDLGFVSLLLDNLFCLTAGSLGLVPLWGNCVAVRDDGVLIFGAENSGKTSVAYVATKFGLDFQADDGVFVEQEGRELRCWSGFLPASFRPDALGFFPELESSTTPFRYRDFTFYHQVKRRCSITQADPVKPIACVFLERQPASTFRLTPIARADRIELLRRTVLFKDDDRFAEQYTRILQALEELPLYVLRYGDDLAAAAKAIRDLLLQPKFPDLNSQPIHPAASLPSR